MIPFLLAWRRPALLLVAVLTAVAGWSALHLQIDPGVESMIPSGTGELERLQAFQASFGSDEVVVLAVHADPLFSRQPLERLDALTQRVATLHGVTRVLSPTNLRDLDGDELGPVPLVPYAEVRAGKLSPESLGQRLAAHPIFGGLLVAKDARTAALLIELEPVSGNPNGRRDVVNALRDLAHRAGPELTAFVAGIPVEKLDVAASIARDQIVFIPLVFLILALMTAVLYRHPIGMLVPLSAVSVALVWTLGLFRFAGRSLSPVTSLMSPVILVMSFEATIQLLNQYLAARADGLGLGDALRRADRHLRIPCLNAALTAAIGFVSLLTLPIPAIRDFGLFTALGILLAYGLTITLTPLLLGSLPDVPSRVIHAFEPGPVEHWLTRVVRAVARRRWTTAIVAGVIGLFAVAGIAQIHIETDLIRSLRHASPLAAATRFIDSRLTGVNSTEIVIPRVSPEDPEALAKVARFEDAVRALPDVHKVTGLPDLVARVNRAMHQGDDGYARLPDGPDAAADLGDFIAALEREAPADLRRFLARNPDGTSSLHLVARVPALDSARSQALFARIRDAATRVGLPEVSLTGNFVVFSNMATTLVRHQIQGLGVALLLILTVMTIQFRSIRLGLLCAIPNAAPVLVVYGLMGWTGVALSVPTAMIASVAFGTIVDNSIYLLARFRAAFARQADYVEALTTMVNASGRAVVYSTVTLAAGFWVGVFSSFVPTIHFGLLTGAAFVLGTVSQFVLLPLLLVSLEPLGRPGGHRTARLGAPLKTACIVALLLMSGVALAQEPAPEFLLKDQFGRADGPGRYQGQVVLLLFGKVDGLRRMKAWELKILEKAPGPVVVLRGLDARPAQGQKTEAEVNERLRQNVPSNIAILIDWTGAFIRAYHLPDADVSVTVLDGTAKACRTVAGSVTDEGLEAIRQALVRTRETGTCP